MQALVTIVGPSPARKIGVAGLLIEVTCDNAGANQKFYETAILDLLHSIIQRDRYYQCRLVLVLRCLCEKEVTLASLVNVTAEALEKKCVLMLTVPRAISVVVADHNEHSSATIITGQSRKLRGRDSCSVHNDLKMNSILAFYCTSKRPLDENTLFRCLDITSRLLGYTHSSP
jgi:hypothetical protein